MAVTITVPPTYYDLRPYAIAGLVAVALAFTFWPRKKKRGRK